MTGLRLVYLALAIVGTVWPMLHYIAWIGEPGNGLTSLFDAWLANSATTGLTADLVVSAAALVVWCVAETRVRRNWPALWAIPATVCIGVSCGLPLYLFLRTRPV
jgi:hypothetical protein